METTGNGITTLEYADRLIKAGFPEEQAKTHAMVFHDVVTANLATKRDIKEIDLKIETVQKEMELKMETVQSNLKKEISELGNTLTIRVLVIVGLFATLLGLLIKLPSPA